MDSKDRKKLFDISIERACISAAINYQDKLVDVFPFITEDHFYLKPHQIIFGVIKHFGTTGAVFDITLLTEKLVTLGIKFVEGIEMVDYLQSLKSLDSISESSMMEYYKTLHKYYNARKLIATTKAIEDFVYENIGKTSQDLVFGSEKIFGEHINVFESDDAPRDLVRDLEEEIEMRGNEPTVTGLINPYPRMQALYGNLLPGGLYIFVAPAKVGKSTLLLDILNQVTEAEPGSRGLLLDTELSYEEQRNRIVSALSGVNEAYIRDGLFRKDAKMLAAVRAIWPKVKEMLNRIDHLYVGGKNVDEQISIMRRWYYKNKKEGFKPIICVDYIKLTGEKVSDSWKEHQVIGQKADKYKQIAKELKCPLITAMQTNKEGDYVAMSAQVRWFCSMLAIFRRKTPDQLREHGNKFGTHYLVVTESRNQGIEALGHKDSVQKADGSFEKMFINFEVENFKVVEKGTLEDIVNSTDDNIDMRESGDEIPF